MEVLTQASLITRIVFTQCLVTPELRLCPESKVPDLLKRIGPTIYNTIKTLFERSLSLTTKKKGLVKFAELTVGRFKQCIHVLKMTKERADKNTRVV